MLTEKVSQREILTKTVGSVIHLADLAIFSVPGSVLRFPGSVPDLAAGLSGSFHRHG